MSFADDNPVDFDMEMSVNEDLLGEEQEETDQTSSDLAEITNLIKECATQCLNYTESSNRKLSELITAEQNNCSKIVEDKFGLMCALNQPVNINVSTAMKICAMHKEQLQKLNRLFKAEDECAHAYATHCTEAIKATEANALKEGFDDYTEMPHAMLVDRILEMKNQIETIKSKTESLKAKYKKRLAEHQAEFNSLLKETAALEKIELESM
ncbi:PREDICTED: uncharacterized protein LOC108618885 [Drosophila arizonae]|uniref:Uncharacterized protein LOC108618885 n=1 Tax=Drosophila arizonae TaxID=7263 RepID=A0ABM1PTN9_DROAR|nr:PREDICTED: uncharacterized protein LOC108618885 [Drosophila arizonae]